MATKKGGKKGSSKAGKKGRAASGGGKPASQKARKSGARKARKAQVQQEPMSPLPAQHQEKPGLESKLDPQPEYQAPL